MRNTYQQVYEEDDEDILCNDKDEKFGYKEVVRDEQAVRTL